MRLVFAISLAVFVLLLSLQYNNFFRSKKSPDIVVIGGALLDFLAEPSSSELLIHTSNIGVIKSSWGGVARNIAQAISNSFPVIFKHATVNSVQFISLVGNDIVGKTFFTEHQNFDTSGVKQHEGNTGLYLAIAEGENKNNDLHVAIAQVDILNNITPSYISQYLDSIVKSKFIVIDGNLSYETLKYISNIAFENNISLWFEPTSEPKSCKLFNANVNLSSISYTSPNLMELETMAKWLQENRYIEPLLVSESDPFFSVKQAIYVLLKSGIQNVITTMGPDGTMLGFLNLESEPEFQYFSAPDADVVQVNGAGDAMAGCIISSLVAGYSVHESIIIGNHCAKYQLEAKPLDLSTLDTLNKHL